MVWDSEAANIAGEEQREEGSSHSVQVPVEDKPMPLAEKLINGFGAGSVIYSEISEIRITEHFGDFAVNLQCGGLYWVGDWIIDHHTPGGANNDATDFPASYQIEPTFIDYVRR